MKRIALWLMLFAVPCAAQSPLGRLDFHLQNAQGQAVSGASVNVYLQPSTLTTLAISSVQVVSVGLTPPYAYYTLVTFTTTAPAYATGQTYSFSGLTTYTALNGQSLPSLPFAIGAVPALAPAANQALFLFGSATYGPTSDTGTSGAFASSACGSAKGAAASLYTAAVGGALLRQPVLTNGFGEAKAYVTQGCYTVVYNSPYAGALTYADQSAIPGSSVTAGVGAGCSSGVCTIPQGGTNATSQTTAFDNIVGPGGDTTGPFTTPIGNGIINAERYADLPTAFAQLSTTQRQIHSGCATYSITSVLTLPSAVSPAQSTSLIGSNRDCVILQAQADTVDTTGSITNGTNTLTVAGTAANYPAGTPIHISDGVNTFDSWSLQFVGQVVTLADNATHTFTGASVKGTLNMLVQNVNAEVKNITIDCNGHPVIGINSHSSAIPDHVKFTGGCAVSFYEYGDVTVPHPGVFYNHASDLDIDGSGLSTVGVMTWTHGAWPSVGWVGLNDLDGVTKVRGLVQATGSCSASVNPTQLTVRDPWQAYYMVNHAASITVIGAAAASADLFTTATNYSGNVVTLASPCLTTVTAAAVHTSPGTMNCGVYNGSGGRIKYSTLDVEAQPIIGACNDYGILIVENGDLEQNTKGAFFNNPATNLNSGYFLNGASSIKANATLANAQTVNATGTIPVSSNQLTVYGPALTPGTVYAVAGATFVGTNANYERVLSWNGGTGIATMASPTTGGGGSGTIPVAVTGPISPNYNQGGGFPAGYSSETGTESTKYTGSFVMRSPVFEGNGLIRPTFGTAQAATWQLNANDVYWGAGQALTTTFHWATGYNLATATYSSGGTSCGPDGNNAVFYVGGNTPGVYMGVIAISGGIPTGSVTIVNSSFNVSGTLTVRVTGCTGNTTLTYTLVAPFFFAPTVKAGALIATNGTYMIQIQPAGDGQSVQLRGSFTGNYTTTGSMSSTVNPTFLTLPTALICRQMAQDTSITVFGAGAAGVNLVTTPASPTCSGAVMTLSSPALTTVSGAQVQGPTYPDINMGTSSFTQFSILNNNTVAFPGLTTGGLMTLAATTGVASLTPLAGSGAAVTTGPASSTSGDLASFTGSAGQIADSTVAAANLMTVSGGKTFTNTWGCIDGYDHAPCYVYQETEVTGENTAAGAYSTRFTTTAAGVYRITGYIYTTTASSTAYNVGLYAKASCNGAASAYSTGLQLQSTIPNPGPAQGSGNASIICNLASSTIVQSGTITNSGANTGGVWSHAVMVERLK